MRRHLVLVPLFSILGFACAPTIPPAEACGNGCSEGRVCVSNICVCEEPELPCRPDCAAGDETCNRGTIDAETCACVATGTTNRLTAITLEPSTLALEAGETGTLQAWGTFSSGSTLDVTHSVTWTSSDETVASIAANGVVIAEAEGAATITAATGDISGAATLTVAAEEPVGPTELRALWVTRWNYSNAADVRRVFQQAAGAGFNTIFFQVRGRADAFYSSSIEPWAKELTGTLGQDPGWDPLATALSEGDAAGLEVHAWINTVPVWSGTTPPTESTPRHVYLDHPEWLMADGNGTPMPLASGYQCLSPGIPAARDHVAAVVQDIVEGYPVAGVHLDYIRYYGAQYSHDPVSEQRFAQAQAQDPTLTYADWQRTQVVELIRQAQIAVASRAGTKLTAATWHNNDADVAGSSGFRDYYQDAHRFLAEEVVDAIVPMNYFRIDSNPSFAAMADDHVANAGNRHVYMGVHVLGRGGSGEEDPTGAKMIENIEYARAIGAHGTALFAYSYLADNDLWDELATGPFAEPARIPPMPWK